ncbi:MAG: cobyrinate a,c-diamide synthase [Treponemataceae bacterium]|nr:cobyrinate a,c-diamide synthase [Treponemataceae bacterium]
MKVPRIIMAAPKSGSGKTVLTISLMCALSKAGKKVRAFKCGPDYIDPMYHKKVLGIDSRNLDLFFTDEDTVRGLFLKDNEGDISVIEGVMGLYDGIGGVTDQASTYHLAKALAAPVVLILDTKGMSRSVIAEVAGFLSMDDAKLIKGLIFNNMSASVYENLKPVVEEKCGIPVLGFFPKQKECDISSRYLGLSLPEEISDLKTKVNTAALEFAKSVDIQKILEIADSAEEIRSDFVFPEKKKAVTRIAVAKDEAFNFYYKDNLDLLENLGAHLVYFSPLHDKKLPENIGGLLLGGGYPELCAEELAENRTMIESIKNAVNKGLPLWAECGGFIYLHRILESGGSVGGVGSISSDNNKNCRELCGIISGKCVETSKLVRFGYVTLNELGVKAHEFHYFDSDNNGCFCTAEKPYTKKQWQCGHNINGGFQGFPHLYYPSNIEYAKKIVETCRNHNSFTEEAAAPVSKNYSFFQNTKCEMFPCHKTRDPDNFNCLFCYCPLYFLGDKCGGNFTYNDKGRKSCINCDIPHQRENYSLINAKLKEALF